MKTDKLIIKQLLLFVLFFHLTILNLCSQTNAHLTLSSSPTKSEIDDFYLKSFFLRLSETETAQLNAYKIIEQSQKINYTKGIASGHNLLGVIAKSITSDFEKAIYHYEIALGLYKELGVEADIAKTYNNICSCLREAGKIDESLAACKAGLDVLRSDTLNTININLYHRLAYILSEEKRFEESAFYLEKSFDVLNRIEKNESYLASYYKHKAILSFGIENYESAELYYRKALDVFSKLENSIGIFDSLNGLGVTFFINKDFDQALYYLLKAYEYKDQTGIHTRSKIEHNIGVIQLSKHNHDIALNYLKSAQNGYRKSKSYHELANTFLQIASVHYSLGNIKEAEQQYLTALDSLKKYDGSILTEVEILSNLSKLYAEEDNTDLAYIYSQKHNSIKDSISKKLLAASHAQTNLELKEKENTQLQNQILQQDKQQLWSIGIIALSVLFSLFMGAGFVAYRNRQKRLVAEYEADQAYLQVDDIIRQQELNLAYARLETKDEMQKQIGQDLHDRLGMMLSTIKLYFGEFVDELKELNLKSSQHQDKTIELLDEAVVEVRRIAHNMQSGILKNFGLLNAVQDLAETINKTGKLNVTVNSFGMKDRVNSEIEGKLFKIIQELIANVLKHAQATTLGISLYKKGELLNIIVEDNGTGFNIEEISDKGGMGLKNITFRVSELGGKCHFDSNEKTGTSVIIDIPLENTEV